MTFPELPVVRLFDPVDQAELIFPTPPESIKSSAGIETRDITLDEFGTLLRPRGRPPTTFSFTCVFRGGARVGTINLPFARWRPPVDIRYWLENLHDQQARRPPLQPLEFEVTGSNVVPIFKPVMISRLDFTWAGGWGDLTCDIELTEWRAALVGIDAGEESGDATAAAEAIETEGGADGEPPLPAQYVVQDGDTLWAISQQLLGDGARWEEIWAIEENQATIGPDPHAIAPGMVLLIPGGTDDPVPEESQGDVLEADLVEAMSDA